jgi:large repetitive protein
MRLRIVGLTALTVGASLLVAPGAGAGPGVPVACGQTITTSTVLGNDLRDCPGIGIVIGASGVTLDLNGHTVDGDGVGDFEGIQAIGIDRVTVRNGTVRDFVEGIALLHTTGAVVSGVALSRHRHVGVFLDDATDAQVRDTRTTDTAFSAVFVTRSRSVRVIGNDAQRNGTGAAARQSTGLLVAGNTFTGNECGGVQFLDEVDASVVEANTLAGNGCDGVTLGDGSDRNAARNNTATGNDAGIGVADGTGNLVTGNAVHGNRFAGIYVFGGDRNQVQANVVDRNGDGSEAGIHLLANDAGDAPQDNAILDNQITNSIGDGILVDAQATRTLVRGNTANHNSDDGIDLDGPSATVTRNTANRNGDLGIEAVPGVVDGGGNLASRNGDPAQCDGVRCA